MCKYLYKHNIQQLRHKLNKFHRHVTNRNGIMCPWTKGGSKSKVCQYLVWPPAALSTAVHLLLMDCTRFASSCCEMLLHSSTKAPASSLTFWGEWPQPSPSDPTGPRRAQWNWDPCSSLAMAEHWHSCLAGNHAQNKQYGWWHCHAGWSAVHPVSI